MKKKPVSMVCFQCPFASICPQKGTSPHEVFEERVVPADTAPAPLGILLSGDTADPFEEAPPEPGMKTERVKIHEFTCHLTMPLGGDKGTKSLAEVPNSNVAKKAAAEGKDLATLFVTFASVPPATPSDDPKLVVHVHERLTEEQYNAVDVLHMSQQLKAASMDA